MKFYTLKNTKPPTRIVFGKTNVIADTADGVHVNRDGVGYLVEGNFEDIVADLEGEPLDAPPAAPADQGGGEGDAQGAQ